jgi:hypothetical protein
MGMPALLDSRKEQRQGEQEELSDGKEQKGRALKEKCNEKKGNKNQKWKASNNKGPKIQNKMKIENEEVEGKEGASKQRQDEIERQGKDLLFPL